MARGKVKWYSEEKGYGFIEPVDGGDDLFVHGSEVGDRSPEDMLEEGEVVEFTVEVTPKGRQAVDVHRVGDESALY